MTDEEKHVENPIEPPMPEKTELPKPKRPRTQKQIEASLKNLAKSSRKKGMHGTVKIVEPEKEPEREPEKKEHKKEEKPKKKGGKKWDFKIRFHF